MNERHLGHGRALIAASLLALAGMGLVFADGYVPEQFFRFLFSSEHTGGDP